MNAEMKAAKAARQRARYAERREEMNARQRARYVAHREAILAAVKVYREGHREVAIESERKRRYGLSTGEYEALVAAQDGRCAICGVRPPRHGRGRLAVDHDHVTRLVRGLLCPHCNTGIGNLGDDPARLRAAADYLDLKMK